MTRHLVKLTIADYDALINLWGDAGLPYRPLGRDSRERIEIEMRRPDTAFFGVFDRDRLVAAGLATFDGRKGWINRLAVHPDFRRQGLAARIVRACEEFLHERGAEIIACLIEDWNEPSMELVARLGYDHAPDIEYFSKRKSADT
ncbi:MAG TPA: GNAT family N-acetyltransferase [candidate division Zixibacteria bacterium]|nr:GNAT family N-acetyltransferase [candidate division Zixibacteria bacterium]MDD4917262.1 GNAT family N-acetyltransferase [candidate division Zixibacteria bacterium]MDM7973464.1 GNAT family N-acetyltransferase [candidate division Zixibacteria bacterium]HOD67479.1 GNAT family N-acetyltransferase [candidate division Zixibacteria bacterium]HOZ06921.1 GNAT family N-acetyltransferase [candidate division Zixibacteria bacterium]